MNPIKAVLFDLDNTLYENDEALEEWALANAQALLTPNQLAHLMGALSEIVAASCANKSSISAASGNAELSALLNRLIPGLTAPAIEFIAAMHANWLSKMSLTPDAAQTLAELDLAAITYGIITNAPLSQRIKTGKLGLEERTSCILISGEFGAEKPDPSIFRAAAECLGIPCENILFVGDSPHHDVIGAHNTGMQAAWLRRGRGWPEEHQGKEPEYVIDSLVEVLGIVCSSGEC